MKESKMKTKNLMVSLCTIALALFLVATVSAADLTTNYTVKINGMDAYSKNISVIAGEQIAVKVYFKSNVSDSDVTVEAELEGEKVDTDAITSGFDVEAGYSYKKGLVLTVPYELKDSKNDDLTLTIEIDGKLHKIVLNPITLRVQRPSYNAVVKSVTTPSSITAGETFPVEVVLKNMGYNDLDDLYVSAKIIGLDVSQGPKWFGDLVYLEGLANASDDDEDTVVGSLNLKVPYNAKSGVYTLEVTVTNDDTETVRMKQIVIENDFSENIIVNTAIKSAAVGEDAVYELLIVNPTNNVKVYRVIADGDVFSSTQSIVAVPAGSSETVKIVGNADEEGKYNYEVVIFEGESIVKTVGLELNAEGSSTDTIVVLTIVLAVIFLVLLVVLIVLLGKKPEKAEDFGESYY